MKPKRLFRRGLRMSPYQFEKGLRANEGSLVRTVADSAATCEAIVAAVREAPRRETLRAMEALPPLVPGERA